jgi:hypothetical protein
MRLVRVDADLEVVDVQERVHRQAALATAATIVMQVHVARARLAVQEQAYRDAERSADIQRQLLAQVRASVQAGKVGQQALIREKLEALLAEVRAILAYAELQAAGAVYATARGDWPYLDRNSPGTRLVRSEGLSEDRRQGLGGVLQ